MNHVCDLCHVCNDDVQSINYLGIFVCLDCKDKIQEQEDNEPEYHEHEYQLNGTDTIADPRDINKPRFPRFKNVVVYSCSICNNEIYEPIPTEQGDK